MKKYLVYVLLALLICFVTCTQDSLKDPTTNDVKATTTTSVEATTTTGATTTTTTLPQYLPYFEPAGGLYKNSVTVKIKSNLPDTEIYYTDDGSTPNTSSMKYSEPILISSPKLLRTMSVSNGTEVHYAMSMFDIDDTPDLTSHKESPNWNDQIIYFLMLDRFYNGDTNNDDQGVGVNGMVEGKFNGGDLVGLKSKLQYIKDLGATAIWITPPVKNQWSDGNYTGYHGYWTSNFRDVDPHFGTIEDYKNMVKAAHDLGLYVIQDIVLNHTGDYFYMTSMPSSYNYSKFLWGKNSGSLPSFAPEQLPWSFNDISFKNPNRLTEDKYNFFSFYHWTPGITDYLNEEQIFNYQMSNLDDINTENVVVRNLLKGYFRYWIDKVDVDGYRIDTVKYIPPEYFEDFSNSKEEGNLGIREYAKQKGKNDFILFGEAWDTEDKNCVIYTKSEDGTPRMDSLIYFPLTFAIRDCFSNGKSTKSIEDILNNRYKAGYLNPDKLVTFIDNHDIARLYESLPASLVKSAYAIIMTITGIPQIYYGSEQGFVEPRSAMFNGGYSIPGQTNSEDKFHVSGDWYNYFKDLISLRKNNRVFRYNQLEMIESSSSGAGLLSYRLTEKDNSGNLVKGIGHEALVIINTSTNTKLLDVGSGFAGGDILEIKEPYVGSMSNTIKVGFNGRITQEIPGQSYGIYILSEKGTPPTQGSEFIQINSSYENVINELSMKIEGTVSNPPATIRLFFDNDINDYLTIDATTENWSKTINVEFLLSNGHHTIKAIRHSNEVDKIAYSNTVEFDLIKPYIEVVNKSDPALDNKGPAGYNYKNPTDGTYKNQTDIQNIKILRAGADLKIELQMNIISRTWNPTVNPFDHVLFSVFLIDSDNTTGCAAHPKHNYNIPNGNKWDYMFKAEGWKTTMFNSIGADSTTDGEALSYGPTAEVNWDDDMQTEKVGGTITFILPSAAFGSPDNLTGWKIYINTWDMDMGKLRELTADGAAHKFGGGDGTVDPLLMDETDIIDLM
ncbi:MAG TPA: alpha-amylase family glycosyl hydrolase [Spirochaetota bacterium]|nr:alpha-amylase family glycosyl hydrolase [Spirochaetota bacterium]